VRTMQGIVAATMKAKRARGSEHEEHEASETTKVLADKTKDLSEVRTLGMTSRIPNVIGNAAMKELKITGLQLRG